MRNLKSLTAILLSFLLILSLAACGGGEEGGAAPSGENTAPTISGAADSVVEAGQSFDAFAGVSASDKEDGDLTSMIVVESSPSLSFSNGKATPATAGSYELVYSVTDKGGLTSEAYATLTVTKQTSEAVLYKAFDFSTQPVTDTLGWEARIGEAASATAELKEGAYVFDIANAGGGDGDIQLAFPGLPLKEADYRVKVWVKSTADTYAHFIARNAEAEGWETFNAVWNARITGHVAPVELNFSSPGDGTAELLFNLGKITPNPDNPADTTPENFTVTVDKIELYEISGEEHEVPVYTADFASGEGLVVTAGDGSAAEAEFADGAAVANITAYPTDGGVWSIRANLGLGENTIAGGTKYYYRFVMNCENAQSGEALVESDAQEWQARAHFNGFSAPAGEDVEISGTFTAEVAIADPVIRLQVGNPSEGVTSNRITFKSVEFGTLEGDKEITKTIYKWTAFGGDTYNGTNSDYPWFTFNGTDEDNEHGVGTIYSENGSFFYRIDDGGTVDWHNKLICGYRENPLTLASDSYYTVEITVKADKPVSCGFFLNPLGGWDPRISEGMDITTEPQTFTFTTTDTFVMDMDFEMLFQFGSEATAQLDGVTVEFTNITIYQQSVL